ncbi:phosphatase PAP2 family protein [Breznakiella homolactica]|uniref:Phosphatase PAP2 family protein n=1 Tax=Breznakiella homolactica TaxID=2798577 RepID=A0A7T7XMT9_9SPIR|nr:phosphatase PAP2 family protein [Breznakiella homolactica]QQO09249.1 phosphatase PAP2 family protein [Breznakiella homolactica]
MEQVYQWGIAVIQGIQRMENPFMTALMKGITFLGTEYVYVVLMALIFWCIDEKRGFRLSVAVIFSAWLNTWMKALLKQPRPYDLDPSVGRAYESSYGIPSGHAQNSLVLGMVLASWGTKKRYYLFAVLASAVIGFTRLYLGVHFPTDLFAGWLLGLIILAVYAVFGNLIEALLTAGGIRAQIITAAAVSLLMNAVYPEDTNLSGLFLGMGAGYSLMVNRFPFSAGKGPDGLKPKFPVLILRYITGLAGALVIFLALKALLPGETSAYYQLGRFVRYGAAGFWVCAGAPWLFLRFGLAGRRDGTNQGEESPAE